MTGLLIGALVAALVLVLRQAVRRRRRSIARVQLLEDHPTPAFGRSPDDLDGRVPRDL